MAEIQLTKGYVAIVDDDDFAWLSQWKWFFTGRYPARSASKEEETAGRPCHISMHRAIVGASSGRIVDHINGDPLDNRRANLRFCSLSQNQHNQRLKRDNTSGFKGVRRDKKRWMARIQLGPERRYLGSFGSAESAARAYDAAALHHFGEFARLNFPEEAAA